LQNFSGISGELRATLIVRVIFGESHAQSGLRMVVKVDVAPFALFRRIAPPYGGSAEQKSADIFVM
jgi:hypothetical protein